MSSATLKGAAEEYGQQRGRIKQSHKLLGTMRRASLWDRLTLWGGAALFAAVVAFIVYKRLAYFVPAALVPNLGALVPAMPAFGLANLTSGLGSLWSPAPSPAVVPDAGGLQDDDPRMQQWQRWADASGQRHAAEDAGRTGGTGGTERELGGVGDAGYREGGTAEQWPDPSDPSYVDPAAARYSEQLSAAAAQPAQAAAAAHPQHGGAFDGMMGIVAPQNRSAAAAAAQAEPVAAAPVNESLESEAVPANASEPADSAPVEASAEPPDLDGGNVEEGAGKFTATKEELVPGEGLQAPLSANESVVAEGNLTARDLDEAAVEQLSDQAAEVPQPEAAALGDEVAADTLVEADAEPDIDLEPATATAQEEGTAAAGEDEKPAVKASLEGLPQDILGGEAEEAEIAHRHAAPHFAEEASTPSGDVEGPESADEQPSAPEESDPEEASEEEGSLLDDLVSATPGLDTVTAPISAEMEEPPLLSEDLPGEPAVTAANSSEEDGEAAAGEADGAAESTAGSGGELSEEGAGAEKEEEVVRRVGADRHQRGAAGMEEPVIESRDGLDAGALFHRLSREGHQAAQQGDGSADAAAGSDEDASVDADKDTVAVGQPAPLDVPGGKAEGSGVEAEPDTEVLEAGQEPAVAGSLHNEL